MAILSVVKETLQQQNDLRERHTHRHPLKLQLKYHCCTMALLNYLG